MAKIQLHTDPVQERQNIAVGGVLDRLKLNERSQKVLDSRKSDEEKAADAEKKRQQEIADALYNSSFSDLYKRIGILSSGTDETGEDTESTLNNPNIVPSSRFSDNPSEWASGLTPNQRDYVNQLWNLGRKAPDDTGKVPDEEDNVGYIPKLRQTTVPTYTRPTQAQAEAAKAEAALKPGAGLEALEDAQRARKTANVQNAADVFNYIMARGGVGLDDLFTNIDTLGRQGAATINAILDTLTGSSKPVFGAGQNGSASNENRWERLVGNVGRANTEVLEQAAKENRTEKLREEVDRDNPASQNGVARFLGDLNESLSPMLFETAMGNAAVAGVNPYGSTARAIRELTANMNPQTARKVAGVLRNLPTAAVRTAASYPKSYIEARRDWARPEEAKKFASLESINQGVGEMIIGGIAGIGEGFADLLPATGKVGRALAKTFGTTVTSPALRTALRYGGNILGETLEENIQSAATTLNKRLTYNPKAKINLKDMAYEGVLAGTTAALLGVGGAFGRSVAANGDPILDGYYYQYKGNYDAVNNFSKAAADVTTDADAAQINAYGKVIVDQCDAALADNSIDFDTRSQLEYLRNGVQSAMDAMNNNLDNIIYANDAFDDAVESAADAPVGDIIYEAANLVTVVAETVDPDEDVVNATIDRLNEAKRDAYNQETNMAVTDAIRKEWEMQRRLYEMLENVLRNRKPEVKQVIAGLLAAPETPNVPGEVTENGLTSASDHAIINGEDADLTVRSVTPAPVAGNPVMLADGESLTAPAAPVQTPAGEPAYNLIRQNYTDTRDGTELNLFTIGKRISTDDYKALKSAVESVGGYYSKFAHGFIIPDEAVDRLPDALRRLNVGIDESQYTPRAQSTEESETAAAPEAETPQAGPVPQFEVLNGENATRTDTAEASGRPEFEVYTGGDVVPVNGTQAVSDTAGGTDVSENGPDIRQNAGQQTGGTQTETVTGSVPVNPLPETGNGAKVNVNAPERDEEERILAEWKDASGKLAKQWTGISKEEFSSALNTLAEAAIATWPKGEDGKTKYAPPTDEHHEWIDLVQRIALELVKNADVTVDNPAYDEYLEPRKYLRTVPIYYDPDKVRAELGSKSAYYDWKRSLFGRLKLTTDRSKGHPIDTIFDQFAEMFPSILDISIVQDTDRLLELARAAKWMSRTGKNRKTSENPYEQDLEQAANMLFPDLLTEVFNHVNGIKEEVPVTKPPEKKPEKTTAKNPVEKWNPKSSDKLTAENFPYEIGDKFTIPENEFAKQSVWTLEDVDTDRLTFETGLYVPTSIQYSTFENWIRRGQMIPSGGASAPQETEGKSGTESQTERTAPKTVYDDLTEALRTGNLYRNNGIEFSIGQFENRNTGNTEYTGKIRKMSETYVGGVPVFDARDTLYEAHGKEKRADIVKELVDVARNNKLLDPVDNSTRKNDSDSGRNTGEEQKPKERWTPGSAEFINSENFPLKRGDVLVRTGKSTKSRNPNTTFYGFDEGEKLTLTEHKKDKLTFTRPVKDPVQWTYANLEDALRSGLFVKEGGFEEKAEPEPEDTGKRTEPAEIPAEGYMKFKSSDEYDEWADSFAEPSLYEHVPVMIDDGNGIMTDAWVNSGSPTTAVKRFAKAFEKSPDVQGFIEGMLEDVRKGKLSFRDTSDPSYGSYSWGVEKNDDGRYYVFLNADGKWIDRAVQENGAKKSGSETSEPQKTSETEPAETVPETPAEETDAQASAETKPYKEIGGWVLKQLEDGNKIEKKDLQDAANKAYGGTMAEGRYSVKDMTDALELGVNRYIIKDVKKYRDIYTAGPEETVITLGLIQDKILSKIPTQTSRTDEQIRMQQFSTPPNIAFLANWAANITPEDTVLEPSAGIGGLASFAKGMGAKVVVNELSERRLSLLETLPFDGFYHENAEQIDNILPDSVKPTVVVMNPPFSANGRTKNKTENAIPHIEAALDRLEPGGRLVAILGGGRDDGGGMSNSAPTFAGWWNDLRKEYDIRANIGIDGKNYAKYGTAFNVRMVIIDKTGPQQGETLVRSYTDLKEIPADLEAIRNDRKRISTGSSRKKTEEESEYAVGDVVEFGGMYYEVVSIENGEPQLEPYNSEYEESSSYDVGDIVEYNGKSYQIVGFEDDGSPLVQEYKKPKKSGSSDVQYALKAPETITIPLNDFNNAIKNGQIRKVGTVNTRPAATGTRTSGIAPAPGSGTKTAQGPSRISLSDLKKQAGGTAIHKITDKSKLGVIQNGRQRNMVQTGSGSERNGSVEGGGRSAAGSGVRSPRGTDGGKRPDSGRGTSDGDQSGAVSDGKPAGTVLPGERAGAAGKLGDVQSENAVSNADDKLGGNKPGRRGESGSNSANGQGQQPAGVESGNAGRVDSDKSGELVQSGSDVKSSKPQSAASLKAGEGEIPASTTEENDPVIADSHSIYAEYRPTAKPFSKAVKHPAKLVESAAMSTVSMPKLRRVPNIPNHLVESGALSDAQLENIAYAGQAHSEKLPSGERKGYFIGDGTGVGKGRQICGIILDSFNEPGSSKKAVWVSEKWKLMNDAKRDWADMGRSADEVVDFRKARDGKNGFPKEGIIFITYDTLKSVPTTKGKKTNLELIEEWLGKNSDADIIFDESHNLGGLLKKNSKGEDGTQKARAGNQLQNDMRNAKVTYLSATGATEIENFAYISRLGLWGPNTAFENASDFSYQIGASGISAMELVARDMKAQGLYMARSISYEDAKYDTLRHTLTRGQEAMYNRWCDAWQSVLQNVEKAMKLTGSENVLTVRRRKAQIFSNMQNFYSQTITSLMMPSVLKNIEDELAAGHSCVIQLTNTNESILDKELMKRNLKGKDDDDDFDDLDLTPRDLLIGYVENAFPIEKYEEYTDESGKKRARPVLDSAGKPVIDKKAVALKEQLLADLRDLAVPEGPLDQIINHFGTDMVAEVTGRSKRVVNVTDNNGNVKKTKLKRDPAKDNEAETKAFQGGDKRILIFSTAGSTGSSYHADRRAKNQQQRIHYLLQLGWRADIATQGFGRTLRTNEVSAPIYRLIACNIPGHKRFVTSIARRLDSLGALTKGDSKAGSGVFDERDNLETKESLDALERLYKMLEFATVNGLYGPEILHKMGLDELSMEDYKNMPRFLNRMLVLSLDEQDKLFSKYTEYQEQEIAKAKENGTLDRGVESVEADKIIINSKQTVYTDPKTGAETQYVKATVYNKPHVAKTIDEAKRRMYFEGVYRMKGDGTIRAAYKTTDVTDDKTGEVIHRYRLIGPNQSVESIYREDTMKSLCEKIPERDWNKVWEQELANVPEFIETDLHMITGTLLPIWGKLSKANQGWKVRARRLTSSDGKQSYLGVLIGSSQLNSVLRQLNVAADKIQKSGKELRELIMKQNKVVSFNSPYSGVLTVAKRRVSNENRMEITGLNLTRLSGDIEGLITESIASARRCFIPDNVMGEKILEHLANEGIRSIEAKENNGNQYSAGLARGKWGRGNHDRQAQIMSINDLVDEAVRIFGIPINTGRMGPVPRNVEGVFKRRPEAIRTRQYGNLPAIAHELGHWFDKKYNLHDSPQVGELIAEFGEELEERGYDPEQYSYESVAEYFREYLSDAEAAERKFPEFTTWMMLNISDVDRKKLTDYAAMTNGYFAADLDRRASAQVHYRTDDNSRQAKRQVAAEEMKRDPWEYLGGKSRDFIRNWFDDLVDLRGFGNTYDLAMYEKQARSIAYGRLTSAMTDKNGFIVGRSLADVLSEAKIDARNVQTFDEYLIARVALDHFEAAERGEKVGTLIYGDEKLNNIDSVMDRISRYERENPTFRQAAEGVYEYEQHLLDLAVNSGLMSEELRDRLNDLYPHYVPLYRVMDDRSQKTRGAARGYANQNTPIARFKGSGRDIYSPIENIIQNTEKFTASSMRNDVMVEFANFIDENDGLGWIAEEIPEAKILDYISTDDLKKRLMDFAQTSDRLDSMNEKERIDLYHNLMTFVGDTLSQWKPSPKQGKHVVFVMRGGKRTYYEIHDEGLYKALTNMDAPQFDIVTKFFGAVTRANKFFYTSSNPQFVFTNPQRDIVTGYVSSTTTDNPATYVMDFFKAYLDAVRNDDTYKEYMRSGGGYMGSVTSDYDILKRVKNDVVKPDRSAIKRFMDSAAAIVPRLVDAGETASRLAEWKRAIDQGASNVEAMRKAQEVTVNFARGGRVVKQLNQYIPFFMAGFNALAHTYDVFVNGADGGGGRNGSNGYGLDLSPEGKRRRSHAWMKWILTTGMLAFLTWLYNYVISPKLTGETEEEVKQRCDNLSNYNKNAFYNVYIGDGKFLRFKKTQDMSIPATILERMAEYYVLDQKDALGGVGDFVLDNILPVNPFGGEGILDGALNVLSEVTMIGTAVDLARNKDFKGSPIVPTAYQYKHFKEEQFQDNTSEIWIALGRALHMSPIQLQYAAEDNFGWAARMIDNLTPRNGQRSLGIVNKLVSDSVYSTDILNNFYDQKEVYDDAAKAYKENPNSKRYGLEDVYGAFKYGKVSGLYTDLNRLTKAEGDNDLSRAMRAQTNALIQTVNEDQISALDRSVIDLVELTGISVDSVAPYLVVPDKLTYKSGDVKVELPMDYDDMVMYYTQSQTAFENAYGRIFEAGYSDDVTAAMLAEAKKAINKSLRDAWLKQLVARKIGG